MGEFEMEHRKTDAEAISIDRKIPLWGILTVVGAIVVQTVVFWNSMQLLAVQVAFQGKRAEDISVDVKGLTTDVKALSITLSSKDRVDQDQDRRIEDLERRLNNGRTGR